MPIIPEKRQLEDHVQGALSAQFWSQGIESARSLTGQSCTAPGEPQPLPLNAPSGLSRTQFLVAAHAVRVPVFPSYCEEHGGTVVDRVLLQSGGQKWWAALTGRVKVQRAVQQRHNTTLAENLSDPDNYALSAIVRLQLSDTTSLKTTVHADSLQQLPQLQLQQRLFPGTQQQQQQRGSSNKPACWSRLDQGGSLMLQLKQQLEWLDLTADLAVNEPSVEGVRRYSRTPLRLAVDLAPNSSSTMRRMKNSGKLKGLLFRVGLHGAVAPVEDVAGHTAAAAGRSNAGGSTAAAAAEHQQHGLSVHCQGAVAVTADKTIWEAQQKPWQAAAEVAAAQHKRNKQKRQQQQQAVMSAGAADLPVQPLQLPEAHHNSVSSSNAVAAAASNTAAAAAGSALSNGSSGTTTNHNKAGQGGNRNKSHHPQTGKASSSSSSRAASSKHGSSKKQFLTFNGQEIPLPLCSPATVQEALQETHHSIERLRTDLRHWTAKVEAGELQQLGSSRKQTGLLVKEPGSCWSSFLPAPHFKVCGLVGLLGRLPLQQTLLPPPGSSSCRSDRQQHPVESGSRNSSSGSLEGSTAAAASTDPQHPGGKGSTGAAAEAGSTGSGSTTQAVRNVPSGKPLSHKARSFLAASATQLDRLVLGGARKLGTNIMQDTVLRMFASGGMSLQLGEMRGNFLDYTRIEAMLDMGLNAPETQPLPSSSTAAAAAGVACKAAAAAEGRRGSGQKQQRQQQQLRIAAAPRGLGSVLGPAAAAAEVTLPSVDLSQQQQQQRHWPASLVADGGSAAAAAGLGSSFAPVAAPAKQQSKHPAFALEDSGVWHSLTLSASQQLLGPVRLRGDWRLALDSSVPCPRGLGGFLAPKAPLQVLQHVAGVRPVVVDSAYGVDVVVPGAGGLVRLVGWYSPNRGEGGLELRLM